MTDFEMFVNGNRLKKKDVAAYLGVSSAFITQLTAGSRQIPDDKIALIKANPDWDTSMFDKTAIQDEPPKQLELDFSKVADACQKAANAAEESARTNRILAESNSKMAEDNRTVMNQLVESIARIEQKIDLKGAAGVARGVVKTGG